MVTQKEDHDGMKSKIKSRLIVRGFQEDEEPRSDSPTLSKEALKVMIAIAAIENFTIRALDVTNAFLQGKPLEREVFVEPPRDLKKPRVIWKLKKTVYGLYDGAGPSTRPSTKISSGWEQQELSEKKPSMSSMKAKERTSDSQV